MNHRLFHKIILLISRLFPRRKNSILICNGRKRELTPNQLHLVNYLKANDFQYTVLTRSQYLRNKLLSESISVCYSNSWNALKAFFSSKVVVVSHGAADVKPFCLDTKRQLVLNVWHGSPVKKIGKFIHNSENFNFDFSFITVASMLEGQTMMKAFGITKEKVLNIGLCKNDILIADSRLPQKEILYLPTFRDWPEKQGLLSFPDKDLKALDSYLEEIERTLIIKPHINMNEQEGFHEFKNIKLIDSSVDAQELVLNSEMLITDYSGIYLDYLLLDRPIVFYPYDLKTYSKKRGFIYKYSEVTPGFHVLNQKEFVHAIDSYIKNPNLHSEKRDLVKSKFHDHFDAQSCKRVCNLIEEHFRFN